MKYTTGPNATVEQAEATIARVEALAEWLTSRPTILTTRGAAALQIRDALAEPERDEEHYTNREPGEVFNP